MNKNNKLTLIYLNKIMEKVDYLKKLNGDEKKEPIICFRGESRDYGKTKLMPSLFRLNSGYTKDKELIELLSDYEIVSKYDWTSLSKSIAGQHFVATSRLLDITFNVLPSLYFATENPGNDGYVYSFVFPESFSPNSEYLNYYYEKIVNQDFSPFPKDFKVVTHSYNNERIKLQSGGFLLFSGNAHNAIPKEYYQEPVKIKKEHKSVIREELSTYFNVTEATIYPEKDKRKSIITEKLEGKSKATLNKDEYASIEFYYYLRRIKYEASLRTDDTKNELKRFLRAEKRIIQKYIKDNFNGDEFEKKEQELVTTFRIIENSL